MIEHIIAIILGLIVVVGITAAFLSIFLLSLDLYFIRLKIENHPVLKVMVDDVLEAICRKEGIRVYHKTYDVINKDKEKEEEKALGMYIYTLDIEHQNKMNDTLAKVEELELEYKRSYKDICVLSGVKSNLTKEDFVLPKIWLCDEKLLAFGWNSYYSTYFHELGHHFAIKRLQDKHEEDEANKEARQLVLQYLPFFFQLFPFYRFEYRLKLPELTRKEKARAYYGYLKYYLKNKSTIVKTKKNTINTK